MILLMIDTISASVCHFSGNINKLFGKIESDSESVLSKSTPIVCPRIASLFKTPAIEDEKVKEDSEKVDNDKVATPKVNRNGMSKFTSTMAWAAETSPLILKSSEKNVRIDGATISMSAESSTPKLSKGINIIEFCILFPFGVIHKQRLQMSLRKKKLSQI